MFNGIWLIATEPLTIQGRDIKAGEQFHISRVHSGALLVTGRATIARPQPPPKTRAPEPPPPQARRRRPRVQKTEEGTAPAETPQPPDPEPPPQPIAEPTVMNPTADDDVIVVPQRRYHRRDLEAEE